VRDLKYNDASQSLRFDCPSAWATTTTLTITIKDNAGSDLLAAASAVLGFTADTTAAAASAGDSTIILTTGVSAMTGGYKFRLSKANDHSEDVECKSYVAATKVVTLARPLAWDHATGSAVNALFFTYALSTSTVATWTAGREVLIIWTPTSGDDNAYTELARVVKHSMATSDLVSKFGTLYPNEFRLAQDRMTILEREASLYTDIRLQAKRRRLADAIDQAAFEPCILDRMAWLVHLEGGEASVTERELFKVKFEDDFSLLCEQPIWFDADQGLDQEEEEVSTAGDFNLGARGW
jgi:hypothetical protein